MPQGRDWIFWSNRESVATETLSVAAILETLLAAPLYWWVATKTGLLLPLLVSACIAPLTLLRSPQSIDFGISLADRWQELSPSHGAKVPRYARYAVWVAIASIALSIAYWFHTFVSLKSFEIQIFLDAIVFGVALSFVSFFFGVLLGPLIGAEEIIAPLRNEDFGVLTGGMFGFAFGVFLLSTAIRILSTIRFLGPGIRNMPRNFRILTLCTSPVLEPELIPGASSRLPKSIFSLGNYYARDASFESPVTKIGLSLIGAALFTPPWLYRLTIKSTAWFWWPLAFLGADVGTRKNPKLVHFQVMGSLWAKTTILFSCASLASFLVATLLVDGAVFRGNPLLTPLGYLLVIDWSPRLWQISAIAVSVLSLALVFIVNYASGEFEIAQESGSQEELEAAERKFDLVQRVARLRFLFAVIFWVLVAAQALLYLNGRQCWFDIPSRIRNLAQTIYGSHLPEYRCQQRETEM